ncbi:MAG: PIG-L deacetylase family protein [Anaerolineae bacterium]
MSEHLPRRALVIMAHPDDPEFFCGGTVARWAHAGCQVTYVVITRGDKGSDAPDMTPESLAILRMAEQRAAAALLGVAEVVFLDYRDGELFPDMRLREDLVRQIRLHRPDTVILPDPTTYYIGDSRINHPDHRAAGEAALAAVFPVARGRLNFPQHEADGLAPHTVPHVFIAGPHESNHEVDISEVFDLKIAAILQHKSQIADPADLEARLRARAHSTTPDGRTIYRELFRWMKLA